MAQDIPKQTAWKMHHVDRQLYNHNSLVPIDVDGDGLADYCVIHEGPDVVTLLFHPGKNGDVRAPWEKVVIGKCPNTENAWLADLDGDGQLDAVALGGGGGPHPSCVKMIWGPVKEETHKAKTWVDGGEFPQLTGKGHFLDVQTTDLNGDGAMDIIVGGRYSATGRLEIVGALIHDTHGNLPADKASVFWMESKGDPFRPENWVTHVIKWSDGYNSGRKWQGEKWDNLRFADVDGDGRLDVVANSEEYFTTNGAQRATLLGVVWFENPGSN